MPQKLIKIGALTNSAIHAYNYDLHIPYLYMHNRQKFFGDRTFNPAPHIPASQHPAVIFSNRKKFPPIPIRHCMECVSSLHFRILLRFAISLTISFTISYFIFDFFDDLPFLWRFLWRFESIKMIEWIIFSSIIALIWPFFLDEKQLIQYFLCPNLLL